MRHQQIVMNKSQITADDLKGLAGLQPNLVLVFGGVQHFKSAGFGGLFKTAFPNSAIIGCSTAGEISSKGVFDNSVVVTAVHFDDAKIKCASARLTGPENCRETGAELARHLGAPDLKAVFVLGQGINVNGTPLVEGIKSSLGPNVMVTGGLAGDGGAFKETCVLLNGEVSADSIVAFGLYGEALEVSSGSQGGWKTFGPVRRATQSSNNVLYKIDGEPALDVYKKYLGEDAKDLPASGLRYPFALLDSKEAETGLIRTILAVDEKTGSLTFAGDIPQDGLLRLMHADSASLVKGAQGAAETCQKGRPQREGLGLLISCVGRKLVMGEDVEDEIDAVQDSLHDGSVITGFYSYGEIAPMNGSAAESKLHNQTMTITWVTEQKAA